MGSFEIKYKFRTKYVHDRNSSSKILPTSGFEQMLILSDAHISKRQTTVVQDQILHVSQPGKNRAYDKYVSLPSVHTVLNDNILISYLTKTPQSVQLFTQPRTMSPSFKSLKLLISRSTSLVSATVKKATEKFSSMFNDRIVRQIRLWANSALADSLPLLAACARRSIVEICRIKHRSAICSLKRHPCFDAVFIHKLHKNVFIEFGQKVNCPLGK